MFIFKRAAVAALLTTTGLSPAFGAEGDIRSVTLSSGGLAEIVRTIPVADGGRVEFVVPLDQVDDVLKSLVVVGGAARVRAFSLGGLSPVEELMRTMPFTADDMAGLPSLLARLGGVRVEVESAGSSVTGTVLGVSEIRGENEAETPVLAILEDGGKTVSIALGPDVRVEILDPSVRDKLAEALAAVGRAKADGSRIIALDLEGADGGETEIAYVVAAPLWKTAYRVVTDASEGTARLQAWAILENATGETWEDVTLTLSSGSPVTLRQRLFERYWRTREEVPVDVNGVAPPEPDSGAMDYDVFAQEGLQLGESANAAMAVAPASPAPAARSRSDAIQANAAAASEGDTSASFAVPGTVDLAAGDTLSVPILDREMAAERVSFLPVNGASVHPLAALSLSNETETGLPPGILTIFDERDGYVGDAQLLAFGAGETRMVSFALDRKVRVLSEEEPSRTVARVTSVDGMLSADIRSVIRTTYRIEGADDGPRTLVIEHAKRPGWQFASSQADGETDAAHRLRVPVEAGASRTVVVLDERSEAEVVALDDADPDVVLTWAYELSDEETRGALIDLAEARQEMARVETELEDLDAARGRIADEQARIRDNLSAVPEGSELSRRYLADLGQGEDELDGLSARRGELEAELLVHREAVAEAVRRL